MIHTNNGLKLNFENVLDADLKITYLLNVQNHLKIMRNDKRKSVPVKRFIAHQKKNTITVIMITTKRYMHIWHECLVMTKKLVDILVTVLNRPIGF